MHFRYKNINVISTLLKNITILLNSNYKISKILLFKCVCYFAFLHCFTLGYHTKTFPSDDKNGLGLIDAP